jgi:hypothetical protein
MPGQFLYSQSDFRLRPAVRVRFAFIGNVHVPIFIVNSSVSPARCARPEGSASGPDLTLLRDIVPLIILLFFLLQLLDQCGLFGGLGRLSALVVEDGSLKGFRTFTGMYRVRYRQFVDKYREPADDCQELFVYVTGHIFRRSVAARERASEKKNSLGHGVLIFAVELFGNLGSGRPAPHGKDFPVTYPSPPAARRD